MLTVCRLELLDEKLGIKLSIFFLHGLSFHAKPFGSYLLGMKPETSLKRWSIEI
jgi:hypothetical protein